MTHNYYVDTDKILRVAREGRAQLEDYVKGKAVNLGLLRSTFNLIERLVECPLDDLPKTTVEFTISNRVICMMDLDVLGNDETIVVGTGGPPEARWYRLDLPRAFALKVLWELEDGWLHGPTQTDRRVFKWAYSNLKKVLGV